MLLSEDEGNEVQKGLYLLTVKVEGSYFNKRFLIKNNIRKSNYYFFNLSKTVGSFSKGCLVKRATVKDLAKYELIQNLSEDFQQFITDITENPIKVFEENYKTIKDLLSPAELNLYNLLPPPNNVFVLEEKLIAKLNEDENYEVWIPLRYWRSAFSTLTTGKLFFETKEVFVSNRGRTLTPKYNLIPSHGSKTSKGYMGLAFKTEDRVEQVMIHRAVCCNFLTPKKRNANKPLSRLICNHKDGIKINNDIFNLEWVTHQENIQHAVDIGLNTTGVGLEHHNVDPVLGVVIAKGKFEGMKFLIAGHRNAKKYGLEKATTVAKGKRKQTKGCSFTYATKEDLVNYQNLDKLKTELQMFIANFQTGTTNSIV